jgi:hypothetical protein
MTRTLAAERDGHFFRWFHLEPTQAPAAAGPLTWHCFRPSGEAFAALVELDVGTLGDGTIVASSLGLARSFIDGGQSPFARDIARSYLGWALEDPGREAAAALIANIGNLTGGGVTVLMRDPPAPAPKDGTGGYAVFAGSAAGVTIELAGTTLRIANRDGALPAASVYAAAGAAVSPVPGRPAWLRIDVSP